MAVGPVLTVLSNIPWGQVVESAPRIAEGAGRLWTAVKHFRSPKVPATSPKESGATTPTENDRVNARLSALEDTTRELLEQVQSSAEVIKALADQNSSLIQRIEQARVRMIWLATAFAGCVAVLAAAVAYLWLAQ